MKTLIWMAAMTVLTACGVAHIDSYTPKQRTYETPASAPPPAETSSTGSLWRENTRHANLFSDYRAFREQDLVVVRIEELADAKRSADTNLTRETDLNASVSAFLQALQVTTPQISANAAIKSGRSFNADGQTARTEKLTATVPAIVKKVLPNGNLFVEGHRVVLVNSEEQHFYISGVVRPIDIAQDNSVRSSYVADAEIEFTGRGVLTENQKPGLLARFWNWIWPF